MDKIRVKPLHEEAAFKLREMIRRGTLRKGQRIVEAEICAAIGVSRTPLREALRALTSEGLIRVTPNKGAYVHEPSVGELQDMFDVMALLEGMCARVAAEKMSDAVFARLERLHQGLEKWYEEGDRERYIQVNNAYHKLVQEVAGNEVLNGILNGLRERVLLHRYRQLYEPERFEESIEEHRELLEAFRSRRSELAEALMKKHLLKQCSALVRLSRLGDEGFEGGPLPASGPRKVRRT